MKPGELTKCIVCNGPATHAAASEELGGYMCASCMYERVKSVCAYAKRVEEERDLVKLELDVRTSTASMFKMQRDEARRLAEIMRDDLVVLCGPDPRPLPWEVGK